MVQLLAWEGGTHSPGGRGSTMGWGQPCSLMGWEASAHFEFPAPLGLSNTTGCCYGCCSWPQFHSAPGQLLEAKGLDWPLLLIPVPDRAFPKGSEVWLDRNKSLAQPCERCPSLAPHNPRPREAMLGSGGLCLWQLQPSARMFLGSQGLGSAVPGHRAPGKATLDDKDGQQLLPEQMGCQWEVLPAA